MVARGLPTGWRTSGVRLLLRGEDGNTPREAVRWLLAIEEEVARLIDHHCVRWGKGVHIKHELMGGIHSFFYERIPEGARVLDAGCGIGALAYDVAAHSNAFVLGLDINQRHIDFARKRFSHPRLRFERGDVTQALPDERIDVVILSSVLEHLENRPGFLKSLIGRLTPSCVLFRVPMWERHYYIALRRELGMFAYTDRSHLVEYSPESFKGEMDEAGLRIVEMEIRWGDIWAECRPL